MVYFLIILSGILFSISPTLAETPAEMKSLWKEALERVPDYPEELFEEKGIVIPAGGEYYLINAWVNLSMLRYHGCQLPVEIWYIGKEEFVPHLMEKLERLGAKCYDITSYFDYPIKGFEVKPHAVLASRFREVMLLDADNVPLSNPSFLFDSQEYFDTGALFWPDLNLVLVPFGNGKVLLDLIIEEDNVLWNVLELEPRRTRGQESGQLVIDKKRCWKALNLCAHMNKNSSFYYDHIYGDKDTFFLSHLVTNTPYYMIGHVPGMVYDKSVFLSCGLGFLQRDFNGEPLFLHLVAENWSERKNLQLHWKYYFLPHWPIDRNEHHFPWQELERYNFRDKFRMIEDRCLRLLKKVKPNIPNF